MLIRSPAVSEWSAGETPWIKAEAIGNEGQQPFQPGYALCYFCGETSAKVSVEDVSIDNGRVQLYCQNEACEAKTVEVIVTNDYHLADCRADVRALLAVDQDRHSTDREPPKVMDVTDLLQFDDAAEERAILARRMNRKPIELAFPGQEG